MKFPGKIFPIVIAMCNVYYLAAWTFAFSRMPTPELRNDLFLNLLVVFGSLAAADVFILIATLGSIILVNFFQSNKGAYRLTLTAVHVFFLALLGVSHI